MFVEDGPTLTSSGRLDSEGSEKVHSVTTINVTVPTTKVIDAGPPEKNTETVVSVQSGSLDDFEFIFIKSDQYDADKLWYKFAEKSDVPDDDSKEMIFEKDHILTSGELIKLFEKAPNFIKFTNHTDKDANINIVVAKRAVP